MDQRERALPSAVAALVGAAALVIVVAGLKLAADLLIPLLFAALLGLVCIRPMRWLRRRGLPRAAAVLVVVLALLGLLVLLSGLVGRSLVAFQETLPGYEARLNELLDGSIAWLRQRGVQADPREWQEALDPGALMALVATTVQGFLGLFSDLVLILLVLVFLLLEADELPAKLTRATAGGEALERWSGVGDRIFGYVSLKALLSLVTGILVALLLVAAGVDFPVLWGLFAFLFNFVPNVGSILAALPPVLLALVQYGPGRALVVGAGFAAINMVLGNVVEPRLMGRRLGLSPLVVILSLVFWAWCWGPVGMILALPLTMVVKILLEHSPGLQPVAVLLGTGEDTLPSGPGARREQPRAGD